MSSLLLTISLVSIGTTICLCLTGYIFFLRKNATILSEQLATVSNNLELTTKELSCIRDKYNNSTEFQQNLVDAELTTNLQKPRLELSTSRNHRDAPEKYKCFKVLVEKGLSTSELSSALGISQVEAQQLVTLSNIGLVH